VLSAEWRATAKTSNRRDAEDAEGKNSNGEQRATAKTLNRRDAEDAKSKKRRDPSLRSG
jgi:hypothetical protein